MKLNKRRQVMSTNINANVLKNFIIKTVGADKLTRNEAQKYDIDANKYQEANIDENNYLELDEIMQDSDLYAQFATMYVEEQDKESEAADDEKQKEEAAKVQDKGESKA